MNRSIVVAILTLCSGAAQAAIPAPERAALINLYNSTNGDSWVNKTNWNGDVGTECTWFGISCMGDHVTRIYLPANNLTGTLPSLTDLTDLLDLELFSDRITGPIPPMAAMVHLQIVNFENNLFTGSIPPLTGMQNLNYLDLANNRLTGSIPSLTGLIVLHDLVLYYNYLSGPIPPLTGLGNLTNLELGLNKLSGSIPPLTGLTNLQTLELHGNTFSGPIPSLSGLTNLKILNLSDNELSGSIPSLAGLPVLQNVFLQKNRLTGSLPAAPATLAAKGSSLCPNFLTPSTDTAWDAASSSRPWSGACLTIPPPPTIDKVTGLYSPANNVQSGAWFSITGNNLAAYLDQWPSDFPTSLGQISVTVNGKPAYLWYVSPTFLNLQAPDDVTLGPVEVKVTTVSGSASSSVTLAQEAPSFNLLDDKHIAGIIVRSDGSGTNGGGTYDIVGPTGTSLKYQTVAAKAGDHVEFFGVGFGPTTPFVPATETFTGAAPAQFPVQFVIAGRTMAADWAGISARGQFQINLTIPTGLGTGDQPIQAMVNGVGTPTGVVLALQ